MEGFVVFDYAERYPVEGIAGPGGLGAGRQTKSTRTYREGPGNLPETLQMLFRGENFGKLVIK